MVLDFYPVGAPLRRSRGKKQSRCRCRKALSSECEFLPKDRLQATWTQGCLQAWILEGLLQGDRYLGQSLALPPSFSVFTSFLLFPFFSLFTCNSDTASLPNTTPGSRGLSFYNISMASGNLGLDTSYVEPRSSAQCRYRVETKTST